MTSRSQKAPLFICPLVSASKIVGYHDDKQRFFNAHTSMRIESAGKHSEAYRTFSIIPA